MDSPCHGPARCPAQTNAGLGRLLVRSHGGLGAHAARSGRLGAPAIDSVAEVYNDGLAELFFRLQSSESVRLGMASSYHTRQF